MTAYAAPVRDMRFIIEELIGLDGLNSLPGCEDLSAELIGQILEEAGRFGADVLAPLNYPGDREGCGHSEDGVTAATGFPSAYARFIDGGWNGVPFSPEFGGGGLPWLVSTAVSEIWASANMAFSLCPLLTQGAVELLSAHGSDALKQTFLENMTAGIWTGAMVMTEPEAGSDVGALKTRAVQDGDSYRITGQKIFITWGDHDMTGNIVHMVLARTADAPAGTRGVSLFLVPKFLVNDDGSLGARNDMRCIAIEDKMGIHASPTCVMAYGDDDGAIGYLIGEENRGIEYMFTMMNNARLGVGIEGLGLAERAYQQARAYAQERIQSRAAGSSDPVTIIHHPDVRRMLLTMKAHIEAVRAIDYAAAGALDIAKRHADPDTGKAARARADLLIPVVKGYGTDIGFQVCSTGVQVHGGVGYIEETGAAQHLRDVRISQIYEGTNGIQAIDLISRKLPYDGGGSISALTDEMRAFCDGYEGNHPGLDIIIRVLGDGIDILNGTTGWMLEKLSADRTGALAGATPYLHLLGTVTGGYFLARSAAIATQKLEAGTTEPAFYEAKLTTALFYAEQIMPAITSLNRQATSGAATLMALQESDF